MRLGLFFKEGRRRKLSPLWSRIVGVLVVLFAAVELYGAPFGFIDSFILRSLFVSFAITLTFICYTPVRTEPGQSENVPVPDILLACISLAAGAYMVLNGAELVTRWTGVDPLTPADWLVTAAFVLLTLEVTRRTVGPVLLGIILVFIVYNFVGEYLPGYFGHRGSTMEVFLDRMVYTYDGIFGTPVGVACTYVFMFVLFGQVFNAAGGGNFFFRLAASIAGRMRGGPAKICVIASALYGTLSGSPVSDVVTTGSITIPLMKRLGYGETFSGAVAASACSGASILPPIMGTAAFLMVDVAGIPYIEIAIAATLPAIIYYFGLMMQVHYRAVLKGMRPISEDTDHESAWTVLKENWLYIIPIALLVTLIIQRVNPTVVGLLATASVVVISWLIPGHRMGIKELYEVIRKTGLGILTVANASAAAGMVIGGIMLTGLGGKFTSLVFAATGGQSGLCLSMVAIVCIILGMGVPTAPAYIIVATLGAPALMKAGVPIIAAHMFVYFYAILSVITPPVCLAAFAGAAIAETNAMKTGVTAMKLGIVAFIIPFMFVFEPALLMQGSTTEIATAFASALIGVIGIASGMQNWLLVRCRLWERALLLASGLMLIFPGLITDTIGLSSLLIVLFAQRLRKGGSPIAAA